MFADVDREVIALKREEEKLIRDIKAAAKTNNTAAMRVLAKSLVRIRSQITKMQGSSAQLRGVSTNLTVSASVGCTWQVVLCGVVVVACVMLHVVLCSLLGM